ncbi:MAG: hypothetical protein ACI8QC_004189, partial [Planctomycetota bacterium]
LLACFDDELATLGRGHLGRELSAPLALLGGGHDNTAAAERDVHLGARRRLAPDLERPVPLHNHVILEDPREAQGARRKRRGLSDEKARQKAQQEGQQKARQEGGQEQGPEGSEEHKQPGRRATRILA